LNIDQFLVNNSTKAYLNFTCLYNGNVSVIDWQFCIYQYYNNGWSTVISYDCIQITIKYKVLSQNCQGFSAQMDIGYDSPFPFETFDKWIVCICATNMCNTNLNWCRSSVTIQIQSNTFPSVLPSIVPQLTTSISCFSATTPLINWLNLSSSCSSTQSAYINLTECNQYVINNIVLCLIIVSGSDVVLMALTKDEYESTLVAYIETIYYLSQDWIIGQFSNWSWSYFSINCNLTNLYNTTFSIRDVFVVKTIVIRI